MNIKATPSFMHARWQHGVTMLELLMAVGISAILVGVSVPSLRGVMTSNQISAQANEFIGALQLARNEAVNRGKVVNFVPTSPTTLNEFGGGWYIWADANGNNDMDVGETFRSHEALKGGNTLDALENPNSIQFAPTGFLFPAGSAYSFRLCATATGQQGRLIKITTTGRISSAVINSNSTCP